MCKSYKLSISVHQSIHWHGWSLPFASSTWQHRMQSFRKSEVLFQRAFERSRKAYQFLKNRQRCAGFLYGTCFSKTWSKSWFSDHIVHLLFAFSFVHKHQNMNCRENMAPLRPGQNSRVLGLSAWKTNSVRGRHKEQDAKTTPPWNSVWWSC